VDEAKNMTTGLPALGLSGPDQHAAISQLFLEQAREELERDDRLQASEKTWGAAAHAIKAIAEQRGWSHDHHGLVLAAALHLSKEFDRPDFEELTYTARQMHNNFYENQLETGDILRALERTSFFVDELEDVRNSPPRPFSIEDTTDRNRLRRLTGLQLNVGDHSPVGFSRSAR
jgi:hypothetical protein